MSVNKKNRSLWGSRSEAQRIYYQRQTIKRLEQENNQLKEQRQELRNWLEEDKDKINVLDTKNNSSVKLGIVIGLGMCLDKLNELEGGKNENNT